MASHDFATFPGFIRPLVSLLLLSLVYIFRIKILIAVE